MVGVLRADDCHLHCRYVGTDCTIWVGCFAANTFVDLDEVDAVVLTSRDEVRQITGIGGSGNVIYQKHVGYVRDGFHIIGN